MWDRKCPNRDMCEGLREHKRGTVSILGKQRWNQWVPRDDSTWLTVEEFSSLIQWAFTINDFTSVSQYINRKTQVRHSMLKPLGNKLAESIDNRCG